MPEASPEALAHAGRLKQHIVAKIREKDDVFTLGEYIHHVLYTPGLGYYAAGTQKFGEAGDFVTAPELGDIFARSLAVAFGPVLSSLDKPVLLELGAGSGQLAFDLLLALQEQDCLPHRYAIVEVSAELARRQQEKLRALPDALFRRVEWLSQPPQSTFDGIVFGNELVDALPFERFRLSGDVDALQMDFVGEKEGEFVLLSGPANTAVAQAVSQIEGDVGKFTAPYCSEVRPGLEQWISDLGSSLNAGAMMFIDYGSDRSELYNEQRNQGTMTCHYRHRVHDDVLYLPGLQDITAWVDFSALADTAVKAGWEFDGYCSQAHFLLGCELDVWLAHRFERVNQREQLELAAQVKKLTMPGEMGERFKVIAFQKNLSQGVFPEHCVRLDGRL